MKSSGTRIVVFLLIAAIVGLAQSWILPSSFRHKSQPAFSSGGPSNGIFDGQCEGIAMKPVAGAVNRVLPHPTNADIMYAGSVNGGVWRSTSVRRTPSWEIEWTPLTDNMPSISVGAMQFDFTDKTYSTIAVAIGGVSSLARLGGQHVGVLKTTDGGDTWQVLGTSDLYGYRLQGIAVAGDNLVTCASGFGVERPMYANGGTFLSTNGGSSFSRIDVFQCTDIATDKRNGLAFYRASLPRGIFESLDAGKTWNLITPSYFFNPSTYNGTIVQNVRLQVVSNEFGKKVIYAGLLNSQPMGLLRGDFEPGLGWTWKSLTFPFTVDNGTRNGLDPVEEDEYELEEEEDESDEPGGQGGIHFSLAIDPFDWNIIYVGGDRQPIGGNQSFPNSLGAMDYSGRLFRGNFNKAVGEQWTPLTHIYAGNMSAPHADSRNLAFDADGNLIESDDGGVYKRFSPQTEQGNWASLNGNLQILEAHSVTHIPVLSATQNSLEHFVFMTGNQDVGTTYGAPDRPWTTLGRGDGGVVRSQFNGTHTVAYNTWPYLPTIVRSVFDSRANLLDSSEVNMTVVNLGNKELTAVEPVQFYQNYQINRYNPLRLVIPIRFDNGSFESFDGGDNFFQLNATADFMRKEITTAIYGGQIGAAINEDLLILGGREYILIREGGLNSAFAPLTSFPPSGIAFPWVHDISVDPNNWRIMYVLFAFGEVAKTNDAGQTWQVLPALQVGTFGDRDSNQTRILYIPKAGTQQGTLLVSGRTGIYMLASDQSSWWRLSSLPNGYIGDMRYDPVHDILYTAVMGRGIWQLNDASIALVAHNNPAPPVANWRTNFFILLGFLLALFAITITLGILWLRSRSSREYSRL